jgi:predicted RNA-binding protein with PIN domain
VAEQGTTRPEQLLVDGYNVIKGDPLLQRHDHISLQAGRQALERALRRYAQVTGARVCVYYDGDASANAAEERPGQVPLETRFSRAPEQADDLIKREIQRSHGSRWIRVITSDREIRRFARDHGIATSVVSEFAEELDSPVRPADPTPLAPPPELDPQLSLSPEQVDFWERLFQSREQPPRG